MRSYDRLAAADADHGRSTDEVADAVVHFFSDCWHLGDWLVGDADTTITRSALTTHVDLSGALQLCGAVAAGHHAVRSTRMPSVSASVSGPGAAPTTPAGETFFVGEGRNRHDALELARQAIEDWRQLLSAHQLVPPA